MARLLTAVALSLFVTALWGCQGSPFPENAPRTPYERYQVLHGRYRHAELPGPRGGNDEPALRQRLKPLRQP